MDGANNERKEKIMILFIVAIAVIMVLIPIISITASSISTYNKLVDLEEDVELAKANVESNMQRRLELIPDLVETAKASSKYKENVWKELANATTSLTESMENGSVEEISESNTNVTIAINNVLDIVDDNPDIISSKEYMDCMEELERSANRINIAREKYNEKVSEYNKMVKKFPGALLAAMFGFKEIEMFKADEAAYTTNMVDFSN